jgi:iron-sulfur cluster assembly protein
MISLTPSASNNIIEQMKNQKKTAIGVKLGVSNSGCNGFVYNLCFAYDDDDLNSHLSFESNHLTIFMDKIHMKYLSGTIIDFVKDGLNENFIYDNPNKDGSCGCGVSFNIA